MTEHQQIVEQVVDTLLAERNALASKRPANANSYAVVSIWWQDQPSVVCLHRALGRRDREDLVKWMAELFAACRKPWPTSRLMARMTEALYDGNQFMYCHDIMAVVGGRCGIYRSDKAYGREVLLLPEGRILEQYGAPITDDHAAWAVGAWNKRIARTGAGIPQL